MPSEATPWEDTIAFKKEKRLQQLHLELRQWLIQRSRMEVDPIDTDIELKAMVQRYETYMQSVRTTKTTGVVELVVKVLGGLVLGWQNSFAAVGQIAVSAKKREAEIMEAEMKLLQPNSPSSPRRRRGLGSEDCNSARADRPGHHRPVGVFSHSRRNRGRQFQSSRRERGTNRFDTIPRSVPKLSRAPDSGSSALSCRRV
jgi:hypothetical protein